MKIITFIGVLLVSFSVSAQSFCDSVLVDNFTMTFSGPYSYTTSNFDGSKTYRMYVNGRYGIADWWSGLDAAFNYYWDTMTQTKVNCNGTQDAQVYIAWLFNGADNFSRPDNDFHNNCCFCSGNDKTYYWTLTGLSGQQVISFTDGPYGDNSGSLSFTIYEMEIAEGCTANAACNYNPEACVDDGSCMYAQEFYDCLGNCIDDINSNGICDQLEVPGCTYVNACNYNGLATDDDGSCIFPELYYDCAGNCLLDLNHNNLCDLEEVSGCTSPEAVNYQVSATLDDGSCQYTCAGDINGNGNIDTNDLLIFLASYGNSCSGAGCMDPVGCNYNPEATFDLGYCEYPEAFYSCEGLPINDADGDGIPDELEVAGCTDPEAVNYNPLATDEDGTCQYGIQGEEHSCGASSVHNQDLVYGMLTDIDGNTYKTIVIGNQEWMAENLNASRYANGDVIPNITDNAQWYAQTQGAWSYYNNDIQYECPYGKFYNWYTTVDARNVCPTGWHVPSDAEWTVLTNYLGGEQVAGGKVKSTGTEHWWSPNTGATDESGFSGLPGGFRNNDGSFYYFGYLGYWWSSTEINASLAWYRDLYYSSGDVDRDYDNKEHGFSVRCLRD